MPTLSRFDGIVIKMYFLGAEHNPPHIHAIYAEDSAAVEINTGVILEGRLPEKVIKSVREWVDDNKEALLEMWESQVFKKLPPLE